MVEPRIKIAGPLMAAAMDWAGLAGCAWPWKTIHIHPRSETDVVLRLHEMAHVAQIEREGALLWTLMSIWYPIRYGYWQAPHEIEARRVAADVSNLMLVKRIDWNDDILMMAEVRLHMGLLPAMA